MVDMPAGDLVATAKGLDRLVIILAAFKDQALAFAQQHDLRHREVVYATHQSVRGYTNVEIVVLPGFHERPDAQRIWDAMTPCLAVSTWPNLVVA